MRVSVLLLTFVLLAGCAVAPSRPPGTLRFALDHDPVCLDPQQSILGQSLTIGRQVVDSLTDQDPRTGRLVPWVARSWEVNDDATVFTFRIRHGITFSDGSALDAAAVKANLDAVAALGARAKVASAYLSHYRGSTVVDRHTVRVHFDAPSAQFLQATATTSLGLLAPATLATSPRQRCRSVIGSGPFVLEQYVPNQRVSLTRRRGYGWAPANAGHRGPAHLRRIDFMVLPEPATRTGSLLSHQVDVDSAVTLADAPRLKHTTVLSRAAPGVVLSLYPNERRLSDPAIRRALSLAIDRAKDATVAYGKRYDPATSVLSHTTPGYVDLGGRLRYDPGRARAMLRADGWRTGPHGARVHGGKKLTVDVAYVPTPQSTLLLDLIKQQWKHLGVRTRLHAYQVADMQAHLRTGDYDLSLQALTRADPDVLRTAFAGRVRGHAGTLRHDLATQSGTLDDGVRRTAVHEAQRLLVTDAHVLPVAEMRSVLAVRGVTGLRFTASARVVCYDASLT